MKNSSGNKGTSLELLIHNLEKTLSSQENVKIESPKRLADRTTGRLREHDVVLTVEEGHHPLIIAIECRDRSRPIGVEQVEAFGAKCQDTGVNQGIIVSSNGFYNTARTKADHLGIRCLDIEEVSSLTWVIGDASLRNYKLNIVHFSWIFISEGDDIADKKNMEVLNDQGFPFDMSILARNAQIQLSKSLPFPVPVELAQLKVKFRGDGIKVRNKQTGETKPVKLINGIISYSVIEERIPFQLISYSDKKAGKKITDAAVADLQLGDTSGKLMIVYNPEKGGTIKFVANKTGIKK